MLLLNAYTPSCWKMTLVRFHVYHFSRKPLTLKSKQVCHQQFSSFDDVSQLPDLTVNQR